VKAAGEPLKELFDLLAFDELVLLTTGLSVELSVGRIRMICGHGNLDADIVGEFAR
jgi:hypothetical protein